MTKILGPLPCLACRKPVWWDRTGSELRLMEGRGKTIRPHDCEEWTGRKAA